MSTLVLTRDWEWSTSFWASSSEFICREGLRDVCSLPMETKLIWAVTSKTKPKHDHYFTLHNERYSAIDWHDDALHKEIDIDFSMWLHSGYKRGERYLTIYYEEIL